MGKSHSVVMALMVLVMFGWLTDFMLMLLGPVEKHGSSGGRGPAIRWQTEEERNPIPRSIPAVEKRGP